MKLAVLLALGILCLTGHRCLAADEKTTKPQPYVTLTGIDSQIKEMECTLIHSESEWIKTWQRHKGAKASKDYDLYYNPLMLPTVNFDQCMVIAIFQGDSSNNAGLKAVSLIEEKERVVLRFENKYYQTSEAAVPSRNSTSRAGVVEVRVEKPQAVYGFFIIPRTNKTVVVEEGTRSLLSEPLTFKERASFAGAGK